MAYHPPRSLKRRRAPKACAECNRRKVRCDLAPRGQPCSNCAADGAITVEDQQPGSSDGVFQTETSPLSNEEVPGPASIPPILAEELGNESHNAGALAAAVRDDAGGENDNDAQTTIYVCLARGAYTGDMHGAVSFVVDLVGTGNSEQNPHYLVPHKVRKDKSPEDLEYLRVKGAFSVPSREVCDALIRTYFLHVHPLLPILDVTEFLTQFTQNGYQNVNLLLLWSIILMAAGFEEPETLRKSRYASRKALRRTAYERAKLLYDNAYDDEQITLIQAVVLMGHWHADAEDRFEAWHWIGIAIYLCQTAGLHRNPMRSVKGSPALTESRERLCRRIWWTCVCRDRWMSMIKGRPLRIRLEDGDLNPANAEDMEYDLRRLPDGIRNIGISHSIQSVPIEEDLSKCDWPPEDDAGGMHPFERICDYHNRLLYCAMCVAFWRPQVRNASTEQSGDMQKYRAVEKARAAAARSSGVLEQILNEDLLKYMKSQSITALVPAMQIHLLDCKSATTSIRVLGTNRLQLYMQVLLELKETYWAADFALKLFERAYEKILRSRNRSGHQAALTASHRGNNASESHMMTPEQHSQEHPTPSSDSVPPADETFMPGYDFGRYSGMDLFWSNGDMSSEQSMLNTYLNADDFSTGSATSP
ncbi:cutinase transcription factor 1 beta (C6 transcription factor) [Seiridium cupressi]